MSTPTEFVFASSPSVAATQSNTVDPLRSTNIISVKTWIDINLGVALKAELLRMLASDLARDNRTGRSAIRLGDVAVPMHCIVQQVGEDFEVDWSSSSVVRLRTFYDAQDAQNRYSSDKIIYVAVPVLIGTYDEDDEDDEDEDEDEDGDDDDDE